MMVLYTLLFLMALPISAPSPPPRTSIIHVPRDELSGLDNYGTRGQSGMVYLTYPVFSTGLLTHITLGVTYPGQVWVQVWRRKGSHGRGNARESDRFQLISQIKAGSFRRNHTGNVFQIGKRQIESLNGGCLSVEDEDWLGIFTPNSTGSSLPVPYRSQTTPSYETSNPVYPQIDDVITFNESPKQFAISFVITTDDSPPGRREKKSGLDKCFPEPRGDPLRPTEGPPGVRRRGNREPSRPDITGRTPESTQGTTPPIIQTTELDTMESTSQPASSLGMYAAMGVVSAVAIVSIVIAVLLYRRSMSKTTESSPERTHSMVIPIYHGDSLLDPKISQRSPMYGVSLEFLKRGVSNEGSDKPITYLVLPHELSKEGGGPYEDIRSMILHQHSADSSNTRNSMPEKLRERTYLDLLPDDVSSISDDLDRGSTSTRCTSIDTSSGTHPVLGQKESGPYWKIAE